MCVAQGVGMFLPGQLPSLIDTLTHSLLCSRIPFLLGLFYVAGSALRAGAFAGHLPLVQSHEGLLLKHHGC